MRPSVVIAAAAAGVTALLAVPLPAAATTTPPPTPPSPPVSAGDETTEPVADPALVRLGDLLDDEDGRLPLDDALAVFAAVVAPLPGIEPVADPDGLPAGAASLAIRRLVGTDPLAADVAAAVEAALAPQAGDVEAVISPDDVAPATTAAGLMRGPARRSATAPTADELAATIAEYAAELSRLSGHELSLPIHARLVGAGRLGEDEGVTTSMGPISAPTGCRLLLSRALFESAASSEHLTSTVLHEVWHCFQLDAHPGAYQTGPAWIIEGQAEWVGEVLVGGSEASAGPWDTWLLAPERALTRRSYDAIGVYAVADASGADPFRTMLPMLGQAHGAALETLFGTDAPTAVLTVASALARVPARGSEWESTGPGITASRGAREMAVPEGTPATTQRTVGRFATLPVALTVSTGDVAMVTALGGSAAAVELADSERTLVAPGTTVSFCLRPDGCLCPDGTPPGGEPLPTASPGEGAAAIGAVDGGDVAVTAVAVTMEDACQTIVGTWVTTFQAALDAGTAPFGGTPMSCDGPYSITYADDGTFAGGSSATCTLGDETALLELTFSGTYEADGTNLSVTSFSASGTVTMDGLTMDAPFPPPATAKGSGTYTIVGATLTVHIPTSAGTVSLSYTRTA